ncbi:MAG: tetratricopeptide repeat protein [Phenylobacterium sp.]|uniref:tetratricopeptide repeat protein n=1 Tax=Phenylobacterium sp. TaxID=1871053 RepID=UPI00121DF062|nr:tetratricopeptide repeat protein [Phenylobacterium sp.]TAJ73876.1 MAG: tetratricopeptide repeat protein [Phenylobacterium sp.]
MTDLFEEVEEQLRSDRYKQFARRALPWMLGIAAAALIATLGYWGYDSYRNKQIATASEQYSAAVDAMVAGDKTKAQQLWTEVSKSHAKAYKALSLMHLGAFAMEARKPAEAVKLFDEAAAAAPDPIVGDAARLKSAFALLDTASLKDLEGRLKPLMEEGHPYRVQAREALAFAKLNAGDLAGARGEFVLISQSLDAQQGAQARAQAAIGLIDSGSAKAVPAVVKAAQALPPPMTIDPGAVIGPPPGAQPQPQGPAPQ